MNVRLYDGTVRCSDHFDASGYESTTTDPCTYCPTESTTDEEWLSALSVLAVTPPRRAIQLDKIQCSWCSESAAWMIRDDLSGDELACTEHGQEWFPDLFPVANVA